MKTAVEPADENVNASDDMTTAARLQEQSKKET
jgi:hypothetical protein